MANADAFIGIDIDVEPAPNASNKVRHSSTSTSKKSSKTNTSRKRPRPSSTSAAAISASASRKRPKNPKPPPNPPSSLVSLLQKDASVRSYFQSLQENLDYDVDKWKHEAAKWKRLSNGSNVAPSQSALEPHPKPKNKNGTKVTGKEVVAEKKRTQQQQKEKGAGSSNNQPLDSSQLKQQDDMNGNIKTIPITDETLFDNDDSSDDDDGTENSDNSTINNAGPSSKMESIVCHNSKARNSLSIGRRAYILEKLQEAKTCLDGLGVSLVEVEVITTEAITQIEGATGENLGEDNNALTSDVHANSIATGDVVNLDNADHQDNVTQTTEQHTTAIARILTRQSDEKVAAEMMASLRTLIKASSFIGYDPQTHIGIRQDNEDISDGETSEDDKLSNEERMRRYRIKCRYHPFCRDGQLHTPIIYFSNEQPGQSTDSDVSYKDDETADMPQHPASIGLKRVINILSIMDTYCGDEIDDDEWNAIFACEGNSTSVAVTAVNGEDSLLLKNGDEEMAILQLGMRSRCNVAERVLSSLDVEITRVWALTDRATNLSTTTLHFHPSDVFDVNDPEYKDIQNSMYGAKSYNRLSSMEERIGHARVATLLQWRRGNVQKVAELVVGYISSSVPSIGAEEYPKLPPVMSLCILEGLLAPAQYVPANKDHEVGTSAECGWFEECIQHMFTTSSSSDDLVPLLLRTLAYPVHVAASIWRERSLCDDDRVRDIALTELAAYHRVQKMGTWLNKPSFELMNVEQITNDGAQILASATSFMQPGSIQRVNRVELNTIQAVSGMSCIIALTTLGGIDRAIQLCNNIVIKTIEDGPPDKREHHQLYLLPACCSAYLTILSRKWETMKLGNITGRNTAAGHTVVDQLTPIFDTFGNISANDYPTFDIAVQVFVLLGDGCRLQELVDRVLPYLVQEVATSRETPTINTAKRCLMSRAMTALIDAGEIPTVRYINLERRPDRALDFMGGAVHREQLIVVKGPARLRRKALVAAGQNAKIPLTGNEEEEHTGYFAFDGLCSHDELEEQLKTRLDGKGSLSDFVNAKWRPSELKAFDRNAREGFQLVPTSMSEKACALSHIAR